MLIRKGDQLTILFVIDSNVVGGNISVLLNKF